MNSVKETVTNEIIINKSKFISILTPINSEKDVPIILEQIKQKYKNATHYCYSYITLNKQKCSDDGEPSGSAGMPILTNLKNNDLCLILCTVVRYFGGIKLGISGLIRAYSKSTKEVINKAIITTLTNGYEIKMEINYNEVKYFDSLLKNYQIKKEYNMKVFYSFKISKEDYQEIENIIKNKIIKITPTLISM